MALRYVLSMSLVLSIGRIDNEPVLRCPIPVFLDEMSGCDVPVSVRWGGICKFAPHPGCKSRDLNASPSFSSRALSRDDSEMS